MVSEARFHGQRSPLFIDDGMDLNGGVGGEGKGLEGKGRMPLVPTKGQKDQCLREGSISACEKGRVRQMVATLEASEKVKETRGHALAKVGRTRSRGNEVPEYSTQAASMGGRRSHFVSKLKLGLLGALRVCFSNVCNLISVLNIEGTAICLALPGCECYQDDARGQVHFSGMVDGIVSE